MRRLADPAIFVGVVAAIVLAAVFAAPPRGPLYHWQSDGGYSGVAARLRPGQVLASGDFFELPAQSTPVVLLGVRPLHPQDARGVTLRYGATSGSGPTGHGTLFGSRDGWHPMRWGLQPVDGFVIPAHVPGAVVVGASSQQPGVHHIRGFILDYRIGVFRYSAPQQLGIEICVRTRRCP